MQGEIFLKIQKKRDKETDEANMAKSWQLLNVGEKYLEIHCTFVCG